MNKIVPLIAAICNYRTIHIVTQYKKGAVYKTRFLGYCHKDRPRLPNELYGSMPTSMTGKEVILEPFLE